MSWTHTLDLCVRAQSFIGCGSISSLLETIDDSSCARTLRPTRVPFGMPSDGWAEATAAGPRIWCESQLTSASGARGKGAGRRRRSISSLLATIADSSCPRSPRPMRVRFGAPAGGCAEAAAAAGPRIVAQSLLMSAPPGAA